MAGDAAGGDAAFAVEACTGWWFVVEELERAGFAAHLAEPADTAVLRGRKRRAKTDRADARRLRELCEQAQLPESWIAPAHLSRDQLKALLAACKGSGFTERRDTAISGCSPTPACGWRR